MSKKPDFTPEIGIDSQEQMPWDFTQFGFKQIVIKIPHGDYTLTKNPNLQGLVTIERKEFGDFLNCCGNDRSRFVTLLLAMRSYVHKLVIVEASYDDLLNHYYQSKITPESVLGSVAKFTSVYGVPIFFANDRYQANKFAASCFKQIVTNYQRIAPPLWECAPESDDTDPTVFPGITTNVQHTILIPDGMYVDYVLRKETNI